jgi:hypothetical protein
MSPRLYSYVLDTHLLMFAFYSLREFELTELGDILFSYQACTLSIWNHAPYTGMER